MKLTEKIPNIEAALKIVEALPEEQAILAYTGDNPRMLSQKANTTLCLCIEAMNMLYRKETGTTKIPIYYPLFWATPGVGFSFDVYVYDYSLPSVGSRLCFFEVSHVREVTKNPYYLELYKQQHS
ncbi:MAG: hypothetical protein KF900_14070 [Bacteroidetes bacterium]|nr:hypothetical protein [Bacteroidota bacterium]